MIKIDLWVRTYVMLCELLVPVAFIEGYQTPQPLEGVTASGGNRRSQWSARNIDSLVS